MMYVSVHVSFYLPNMSMESRVISRLPLPQLNETVLTYLDSQTWHHILEPTVSYDSSISGTVHVTRAIS